MLLNYVILSISVSIDSLGIGITYGIKNTKISISAKLIIWLIATTISLLSSFMGKLLSGFLPAFIIDFIPSFLLCIIGIWILSQGILSQNNSFSDFDNSNKIDTKEALFLGLSLSVDLLGIGIGSYFSGMNMYIFALCVGFFQLLFLLLGTFIGRKIISISKFSPKICNIISGVLLIFIGIANLF